MLTIRTDLAAEAHQLWQESAGKTTRLPGVLAREEELEGFPLTRVEVLDGEGEAALGKPRGSYITLTLEGLSSREEGIFPRSVRAVADELFGLIQGTPPGGLVLVAGLGNRAITPDAVGPKVHENVLITRHLVRQMPEHFGSLRPVASLAAEVMGIPDHSIGEQLYLSKVYLDTGGIFAWTVVIILLSFLFEKMVLGLLERFLGWEPSCRGQKPRDGGREGKALELSAVTKGYQGRQVLQAVSAVYEPGGTYLLTEPSGSGKTTLLRILAGLTPPDRGSLSASPLCSMVFQEDRLCEEYSGLKNVELVTGDRAAAAEALGQLLEAEALERPCSELSGGMKRRVALVRALAADSDLLLLDEPFTGMDALTRRRAEEYIQTNRKGRTLVMADHREGSARNPGAE